MTHATTQARPPATTPARSRLGRLRGLAGDTRGTTALEVAMIMPVFFGLLLMTIEFGATLLVSSLMEGALRDASRFGITGQGTAEDRLTQIEQIIADTTQGLIDMETATVEILTYPTFGAIDGEDFVDGNGNGEYDEGETFTDINDNGMWDADPGVEGPGDAEGIVVYRLSYEWSFITPFYKLFTLATGARASETENANGTMTLQASIAVRNEPWNQSGVGADSSGTDGGEGGGESG